MLPEFSLLILILSLAASCPSQERLSPCTCESSDTSKYITCSNIDNDFDLLTAVSALKGVKNIYSFVIENSVLNYIPHNLFEDVQLVELEFLSTSLMAFTDTDVAFVGLENSLEILFVTECTFMNSWDWSLLKNMKKLIKLDIIEGDLENIGEDVYEMNSLHIKDISFANNKISYVYENAFSKFSELKFLSLSNNLIKVVKRSMLPNPAPELMQLDLSYNEIQELPLGMFENMPHLEVLSIGGNKLLTLNEKVFKPIWEQLVAFQAMDNKLRCDCRMSWITDLRQPRELRATCDLPQDLKGRNLASLTSKDLWCFASNKQYRTFLEI